VESFGFWIERPPYLGKERSELMDKGEQTVKQPIRISLGLASMLAIGLFVLGTASEAQATSGGCFVPTFAVDMLQLEFPEDFVSDRGRCNSQCGKIHTACRRVAHSAAKCMAALLKGESGFERIGCTDEEDVRACKSDVKDDFSGEPESIRRDHAFAREDCSDERESCRDDCSFEGEL